MNFKKLLEIETESFNQEKYERNKFLARIFGIFNEEIVRIWCKSPTTPYIDLGRPTIYAKNAKKGNTLDFTLMKKGTGEIFIAEMKSWLAYNKYKFLELDSDFDFETYAGKSTSFKNFLKLTKNPKKFKVKIKKNKKREVKTAEGGILIWPVVKETSKKSLCEKYGFHDILSLEDIISDLIKEKNVEYINFLKEKKSWIDYLFSNLIN